MPKVTYTAQTPDDPVFTRVGSVSFEHGKPVEVSDEMAESLKGNPWFTGGAEAKRNAEGRVASQSLSPGPSSGIDSSVMPANAPGQGMKHDPDTFMTADGMKPAADADVDETIGDYEVKHKGRGVYDILKGGETVKSGVSKDDADAWVKARSA